MTAQAEGYSHGKHMRGVQDAARAVGIKGAAFAVLAYMCTVADHSKPVVLVSKETIVKRTGYCLDSVKTALRTLRAAGILEPIAYETGGQGRATVYKIRKKGHYGVENTPPNDETPFRGGKSRHLGVEKTAKYGGKNSTTTSLLPDLLPEEKGAASRGGRATCPLDAGASPGPRAGTPQDAEDAWERTTFRRVMAESGGKMDLASARMAELRAARLGQAGDLP